MKLVRLKLKNSSIFWNLPPIRLFENQVISPLIKVDLLTDSQKEIINKSVNAKEIIILDVDNNIINGDLNNINMISSICVSIDDIEEEEDVIPKMISVTEEDPIEEEEWSISKESFDEAKILLKRNGNTIKKAILAFDNNDENFMLLHACLQEEIDKEKSRKSVVKAIELKISEY